jgi:hypothetical protein
MKFLYIVRQLNSLIAFSLKSFGRIRTAPNGSTMSTTWLTVVKGYICLELNNELMRKITLRNGKSNQIVRLQIYYILKSSFHYNFVSNWQRFAC